MSVEWQVSKYNLTGVFIEKKNGTWGQVAEKTEQSPGLWPYLPHHTPLAQQLWGEWILFSCSLLRETESTQKASLTSPEESSVGKINISPSPLLRWKISCGDLWKVLKLFKQLKFGSMWPWVFPGVWRSRFWPSVSPTMSVLCREQQSPPGSNVKSPTSQMSYFSSHFIVSVRCFVLR